MTVSLVLIPVYFLQQSSMTSQRAIEEIANETEEIESVSLLGDDNNLTVPSTSTTSLSSKQKSRRRPVPDLAEQQMATAFGQLTNALSQRQFERPPPPKEEDECDLYGKLLARKLRNFLMMTGKYLCIK